ncbi:P-loop containing nucleoside triphosphate hydrolase protein [Aspergillus pseudoustus]|uniref:P-loop containing nucleoside triphosphate hydrolase protein n=1 Tax=Aspergillus pseudoustus TaxID=1810923 RepID=A0ABR4K534_9EURO
MYLICRKLRLVAAASTPLLKPARLPWRRPTSLLQQPQRWNSAVAATSTLETPAIQLRDYQEECIQSVLSHVGEGHRRLGISLATGSGKTVIFTQLIGRVPPRGRFGDKTLIIVHRRELVDQAYRHCCLAYPNSTVEIEMGNRVASGNSDIIIASVRSLTSGDRLEKFDPRRFKLVLVDEAHHIVASTYRKVLSHFGLGEKSPDSPILVGVSATFSRFDGLKLGAAIDQIVYHKDYTDMIDENWLANAMFTTVKSEADLKRVRKDKFGDFSVGSLSKAVNTIKSNDITVRAWLANASARKSTLVFCVDIEHTKQLTAAFRQYGIDARYITGTTSKTTRDEQLHKFRDREYPVLLNCGLFTEGTDIPNIDCVLLARPTRSRNLLIQMIGRGLRLYPGKKDCHIIDMVATLDTGVISTPTLFGLHPDEVLKEGTTDKLKEKKSALEQGYSDTQEILVDEALDVPDIKLTFTKYDTIYDLIHDMKSEKHIRSLSHYAWVRVGENKYLLSGGSGWLTLEYVDQSYNGSSEYCVHHVTTFKDGEKTLYTRPRLIASAEDLETAVRAADTFAAAHFVDRYISTRQRWRNNVASGAQIDFLNAAKIREGTIRHGDLTRGQAADLIIKLRFGSKKRFEGKRKRRAKHDEKIRDIQELQKRGEVKVGPLDA